MRTLFTTGEGRVSVGAVLLNNALITMGFIFFKWDLSAAVVIFWAEGIVAGLFGVLKTAIRSIYDLDDPDDGPVLKGYFVFMLVAVCIGLLSLMVFMSALFLPIFINMISDEAGPVPGTDFATVTG